MAESEKRHLNVILEEMNGKLNLVLDGHEAIRKEFNGQLDAVRGKQDLFESLLKFSHDELKKELQSVDQRSEERDRKLAAELKETREELRDEMAAGFKVLGEKVEGHEQRIEVLKRKVA